MNAFITSGTPCDRCFIPMDAAEDQPTIVETGVGQITAHWKCLPPDVQAQVVENQKKEKAQWN